MLLCSSLCVPVVDVAMQQLVYAGVCMCRSLHVPESACAEVLVYLPSSLKTLL